MSEAMTELERDVERVDSFIAEMKEEEQTLLDAIRNISTDLENSADVFVATTGRTADEYYPWRRRATQALLHRERRLAQVRERIKDAEADRSRLSMLLLSQKLGYRGQDPLRLLDAVHLLLLDVLERSGLRLDERETALVATARLACGYGAPGERVRA